jgi:hypothetical protein
MPGYRIRNRAHSRANPTLAKGRRRSVAVAIPARDEGGVIASCLAGLAALRIDDRISTVTCVLVANNCSDHTARAAAEFGLPAPWRLDVRDVELPPARANAGWARRLALDAAADRLAHPHDVILSTDADTLVDDAWLCRTLDYLDMGYDAVAGLARLNPRELRRLDPRHRRRLALIQKYDNAISFLKAAQSGDEPWPRHFYEGGASMALTCGVYRAIGGAPTPAVGEDMALFDAIRRVGGAVRHPTDVRVMTSPRLSGRAVGGASDTLARWGAQGDDEVVGGLKTISGNLGLSRGQSGQLTFSQLPRETERARELVRALRLSPRLAMTG